MVLVVSNATVTKDEVFLFVGKGLRGSHDACQGDRSDELADGHFDTGVDAVYKCWRKIGGSVESSCKVWTIKTRKQKD